MPDRIGEVNENYRTCNINTINKNLFSFVLQSHHYFCPSIMSNKQQLMAKLKEFTENMRNIKKITSDGLNQNNREEYRKLIETNGRIVEAIQVLFKQIYNSQQSDITVDKLKKEFSTLLNNYQQQLKKYQEEEHLQIRQLRKTYAKLRESKIQKQSQAPQYSQSERGVSIMMVQVNQQTLHYERMIEIKQKEIRQIKDKMVGALRVQQDMKNMVFEQGQNLNKAETNIDDANKNVHEAQQDLNEAVRQHMSANKKKICIFVIVLALLLVIIVPILIKFT